MPAPAAPTTERLHEIMTAVDRVERAGLQLSAAEHYSHECFRVLAEVVHRTIDEPLAQLRAASQRLLSAVAPGPVRPGE